MTTTDSALHAAGPAAGEGWQVRQITFGSERGAFHTHSYYDIPVWDTAGRRVIGHRLGRLEGQPEPGDAIEVGIADADVPGTWTRLGESTAWSWQQGPLAQWVPGRDLACWNDCGPDGFVARLADPATGETRTLPRPVYALDSLGRFALSLDMARLERMRPGYGYAVTLGGPAPVPAPAETGVWRMALDGDAAPRLILPLADAVAWLMKQLPLHLRALHRAAGYYYWFNHAKIAPDGRRFTVKLRWRRLNGGWKERQGVSLTCGTDGSDLRLLADATSHVIWQDEASAYLWRNGELALFSDTAPRGRRLRRIGPGVIEANVHARHLPPGPSAEPAGYVFDTPYSETIDLKHLDAAGTVSWVARFANHRPARGPFRCDLHPVPDPAGRRIAVTSPHDGGRQIYVVERQG